MKKYMDIEKLRDKEEKIGEIVRGTNTGAFIVGDHINISEKYDGSNASIENVDGKILAFSRRLPVVFDNTLNGFYQYIQNRIAEGLNIPENIVIFGEWSGARNRIVYEKKNTWFVFDIFDRQNESYWKQDRVKSFCEEHNLTYINVLYDGPFISWEHCRSFMHSPFYGATQEGIVVKNQDKLETSNDYFYLKIVNEDFIENKKQKIRKEIDPTKEKEKKEAEELIKNIVTRNRIEKMLFKMRDEGIIANELKPEDMRIVSQNLPKLIYEDCMKEEKETMIAAGEYAGKMTYTITMDIARKIILG